MGEFKKHLEKSRFIYISIIALGLFLGVISFFSIELFLLIITAIPLIVFVFLKPEIALLTYIFLIPFNNYIPRIPLLNFSVLSLILITLAFILLTKFAKKEKKFVNVPQNLYFLGFILVAIFSTIFASYTSSSLIYLKGLFRNVLLYFLIIHFISSKKLLKWAILVLVFSGFIMALWGIDQYLLRSFGLYEGAILGPTKSRCFLATLLVSIVPLAFFSFKEQKSNILKVALIAIFFVLSFATILTFSRGGLIALIFIFFLIILKQKKKFSTLIVFLIIFLIFSSLLPMSFWLRTKTLVGHMTGESNTIIDRARFLTYGINMFLNKPLLGVGPRNFRLLSFLPFDIHNMYVGVLVELGIFGFIFFCYILFLTFKSIKNFKNEYFKNSLELSFISFLISGLFLTIEIHPVLFWIIISLSAVQVSKLK